jgi:hypothetical protein
MDESCFTADLTRHFWSIFVAVFQHFLPNGIMLRICLASCLPDFTFYSPKIIFARKAPFACLLLYCYMMTILQLIIDIHF